MIMQWHKPPALLFKITSGLFGRGTLSSAGPSQRKPQLCSFYNHLLHLVHHCMFDGLACASPFVGGHARNYRLSVCTAAIFVCLSVCCLPASLVYPGSRCWGYMIGWQGVGRTGMMDMFCGCLVGSNSETSKQQR